MANTSKLRYVGVNDDYNTLRTEFNKLRDALGSSLLSINNTRWWENSTLTFPANLTLTRTSTSVFEGSITLFDASTLVGDARLSDIYKEGGLYRDELDGYVSLNIAQPTGASWAPVDLTVTKVWVDGEGVEYSDVARTYNGVSLGSAREIPLTGFITQYESQRQDTPEGNIFQSGQLLFKIKIEATRAQDTSATSATSTVGIAGQGTSIQTQFNASAIISGEVQQNLLDAIAEIAGTGSGASDIAFTYVDQVFTIEGGGNPRASFDLKNFLSSGQTQALIERDLALFEAVSSITVIGSVMTVVYNDARPDVEITLPSGVALATDSQFSTSSTTTAATPKQTRDAIAAERTARESADNTLTRNLTTETADRTAADVTINERLDDLAIRAGEVQIATDTQFDEGHSTNTAVSPAQARETKSYHLEKTDTYAKGSVVYARGRIMQVLEDDEPLTDVDLNNLDASYRDSGNTTGPFRLMAGDGITIDQLAPELESEIKKAAVPGPQGEKGEDGAPGAQGEQGVPGQDGTDGAPGQTGPAGRDGRDGAKGDQGPQGTSVVGLYTQITSSGVGSLGRPPPSPDADWVFDSTRDHLVRKAGAPAADANYALWQSTPTGITPLNGEIWRANAVWNPATQATGPWNVHDIPVNSATVFTGPPGADGAPGEQGIPGRDGRDGAAGRDGQMGVPGQQGIQGIPGVAGARGATGPKGDKGDDGAQGPMGLQGIQGEKGEKGDAGTGTGGGTRTYTVAAEPAFTEDLSQVITTAEELALFDRDDIEIYGYSTQTSIDSGYFENNDDAVVAGTLAEGSGAITLNGRTYTVGTVHSLRRDVGTRFDQFNFNLTFSISSQAAAGVLRDDIIAEQRAGFLSHSITVGGLTWTRSLDPRWPVNLGYVYMRSQMNAGTLDDSGTTTIEDALEAANQVFTFDLVITHVDAYEAYTFTFVDGVAEIDELQARFAGGPPNSVGIDGDEVIVGTSSTGFTGYTRVDGGWVPNGIFPETLDYTRGFINTSIGGIDNSRNSVSILEFSLTTFLETDFFDASTGPFQADFEDMILLTRSLKDRVVAGETLVLARESNYTLEVELKGGLAIGSQVRMIFTYTGSSSSSTDAYFHYLIFPKIVVSPGVRSTSAGVTAATQLTDIPNSYDGQGGKIWSNKADGTGVEFIDPPTGGGDPFPPQYLASTTYKQHDYFLFEGNVFQVTPTAGWKGDGTVSPVYPGGDTTKDPLTFSDATYRQFILESSNPGGTLRLIIEGPDLIPTSIADKSIEKAKLSQEVQDVLDEEVLTEVVSSMEFTGNGKRTNPLTLATGGIAEGKLTPDLQRRLGVDIGSAVAELNTRVAYQNPVLTQTDTSNVLTLSATILAIEDSTNAKHEQYSTPTFLASHATAGLVDDDYSVRDIAITNDSVATRKCLVIKLRDRIDAHSQIQIYVAPNNNVFPTPQLFSCKLLSSYTPANGFTYSIDNARAASASGARGIHVTTNGVDEIYMFQVGTSSELLVWVNILDIVAVGPKGDKGDKGDDGATPNLRGNTSKPIFLNKNWAATNPNVTPWVFRSTGTGYLAVGDRQPTPTNAVTDFLGVDIAVFIEDFNKMLELQVSVSHANQASQATIPVIYPSDIESGTLFVAHSAGHAGNWRGLTVQLFANQNQVGSRSELTHRLRIDSPGDAQYIGAVKIILPAS